MSHTNSPYSTDTCPKSPNDGPLSSDSTSSPDTPASGEPTALTSMVDTGHHILHSASRSCVHSRLPLPPLGLVSAILFLLNFLPVRYGITAQVNTRVLHVRCAAFSCYLPSLLHVSRYIFGAFNWTGQANGFLGKTSHPNRTSTCLMTDPLGSPELLTVV